MKSSDASCPEAAPLNQDTHGKIVDGDSIDGNNGDGMRLKQTIGLFTGVNLIVGTIVGSGIFVSPKGVLLESGSIGSALIIWALCGVVALIGALCFAELGTCIRKSGGQYAYIQECYGPFSAFLFLWSFVIVVMPAANAVIALTYAHYILQPFFPSCESPDTAVRLMAATSICLLTFINCISVPLATHVQNVFSVVKTLALILIIITGVVVLAMGKIDNYQNIFENSVKDPGKIALAFYSGMFSYSGWYTLNFLTEEMKNPYKNLPRSIWISMPLVTFIYVMANVAYFTVLTPTEILESQAVAVTFATRMYGIMAWIMPILVACSCFGSLNGGILMCSRLFFVGARQGHLPDAFALITMTRFTPVAAVCVEGIFTLLFLLGNDVFILINYVTFLETLGFALCVLGILILRYKHPDMERPIKVNILFPIIFLVVCAFLIVLPLVTTPNEVLIAIGILATGIPVYFIFVLWKKKPTAVLNFSATFTKLMQKILMGLPQEESKVD